MPKQHSTRSVPGSRKIVQKDALNKNHEQVVNATLSIRKQTHYCELARLQVIAALPHILQGLIEKAINGGYQQAKLLLDLCDLTETNQPQIGQENTQQLCDALLEGLQLPTPHLKID